MQIGPATEAVGYIFSKLGKVLTDHSQPYRPPAIRKAAAGDLVVPCRPGRLEREKGREKKGVENGQGQAGAGKWLGVMIYVLSTSLSRCTTVHLNALTLCVYVLDSTWQELLQQKHDDAGFRHPPYPCLRSVGLGGKAGGRLLHPPRNRSPENHRGIHIHGDRQTCVSEKSRQTTRNHM